MKSKKKMKLEYVYYLLALFVLVLLAYAAITGQSNHWSFNSETVERLGDVWHYELADQSTGTTTLPAMLSAEPGEIYTISCQLPAESFSGQTLRIRTSQQTLRVLIDGQEIYAYGQTQQLSFLKGPGSLYHFIRIAPDAAAKTLTLELSSVYRQYAGYVNEVAIGTKTALVMDAMTVNLASFLICILIAFMGFVLIGSYVFFRQSWAVNKGALYLGICALSTAIWSAAECKMVEFIVPNPTVVYLLTFASLILIPPVMLLFLRVNYPTDLPDWVFQIIGSLVLLLTTVILLLQVSGTADLMETLPLCHISIALVCGLLLIVVIRDLRQRQRLSALTVGLLLLGFCGCIDLLRFYGGGFYGDSAATMRIGMLLFVIILGSDAIVKMYRMVQHGLEYNALERIAYIDVLVKCGNRTAFERVMEQLAAEPQKHPHVEIMMVDVNNFKHFNDHYGHQVGDSVLQAVSHALQTAFEDCAVCYRVGGDEFILLALSGFDHLEARMHQTDALMKKASSPYKVDIAYGKAGYADCEDGQIWTVYQKADERMYRHKHQNALQKQGDDNGGQTD